MKKLLATAAIFVFAIGSGCAHKKKEPLTLKELQSKRVALALIDGGAQESTKHVEVAVVNEIIENGRFEIVDRASVREALTTYPSESDWKRLGEKLDADYVMSVKISDFKVNEREGFDSVEEEDSVLTEESGETKNVVGKRYVKVKGYTGSVKLKIRFFDVSADKMLYEENGVASDVYNTRDKDKKGMIQGKMQLLEKLTTKALGNFFAKMK